MKVSLATESPFDRSLWAQMVVRREIIAALGSVTGLFPLCPDGARALLHWRRPVPSMHSAIPLLADSSLHIRGRLLLRRSASGRCQFLAELLLPASRWDGPKPTPPRLPFIDGIRHRPTAPCVAVRMDSDGGRDSPSATCATARDRRPGRCVETASQRTRIASVCAVPTVGNWRGAVRGARENMDDAPGDAHLAAQ
jgi:hypothetical protein